MITAQLLSDFNSAKANFDDVYVAKTPVPYMSRMSSVEYEIPQNARHVFEQLIHRLTQLRGRSLRILDVGSSYGINASLLRYELDLRDLYLHYSACSQWKEDQRLLLAADQKYFGELPRRLDCAFIGVDSSANAIFYATRCGLLENGLVMDLEDDEAASSQLDGLDVDLIISTGVIGYIGPVALGRVLDLCRDPRKVWIASFVLRLIDFDPYATVLASRGLATECGSALFVQRRIANHVEQAKTEAYARSRGLYIDGIESTGRLFARFYLSRRRDTEDATLAQLLN